MGRGGQRCFVEKLPSGFISWSWFGPKKFRNFCGLVNGEGNGNPLQYSCLEDPWMEETGGLLYVGSQRVGLTE